MNPLLLRNVLILLVLLGFGLTVAFLVFRSTSSSGTSISMAGPDSLISHVKDDVRRDAHIRLTQVGNMVTLDERGRTYHAAFDQRLDLLAFLRTNGVNTRDQRFQSDVKVEYHQPSRVGIWATVAGAALSFVVAVVLVLYVMNRSRGGL